MNFKKGDRIVTTVKPLRYQGSPLQLGYPKGELGTIIEIHTDSRAASVQFDRPSPKHGDVDDGRWAVDLDCFEPIQEVTDDEIAETIASIRRAL